MSEEKKCDCPCHLGVAGLFHRVSDCCKDWDVLLTKEAIEKREYRFSEPVKIDIIEPPKMQEVTGEPAIGWKTYMVLGAPVHWTVEDVKNEVLVTDRNALREGMELIVPSLFGYTRAVVNGSGAMAETEKALYPLKYDEERGCWVCDSCIMKSAIAAIAKMELK